MGGVVAVSLLPSPHISAIITMSTPHVLPPARFDARMDKLYAANAQKLFSDPTPILSICGGATDMTVPSESCNLPEVGVGANLYRRTVFTTALEGAWTGVGHQAIVWCHQVRWKVARAALELGSATSKLERIETLDEWLRDGHLLPPMPSDAADRVLSDKSMYTSVSEGTHLRLELPQGNQTHLLRVPNSAVHKSRFVLFVSQGSVQSISPYHPGSLEVFVHLCRTGSPQSSIRCSPLKPAVLQLLPNPPINRVFPLPDEGIDESEGVVLYEAEVPAVDSEHVWIGVQANAHGRGWVVGGFNDNDIVIHHAKSIGGSNAAHLELTCLKKNGQLLFWEKFSFAFQARMCSATIFTSLI
jgi:glycosylphosphatidylinositol deacylase